MEYSPLGGRSGGSHVPSWALPVAGLAVIGLGGLLLGGIDGGTETTASATSSSAASRVPSTAPATTSAQPAPTATEEPPMSAPLTTTAPTPTASTTAATAPTSTTVDFAMPDLVGSDLQSAQNAVQDLGVFYSVSHDLLGSRNQVIDSNWIVCTQNVAPGQRVTGEVEGQLDFGVVKREETCP